MKTDFVIPTILFLTCLAIRTTYEILKERDRINSKNKSIFAIVFTAMCILWLSWFTLCPADPNIFQFPAIIHWIGFTVFIIGMILAIGALIQLRGVENIDHLVTTGMFKKIRHPMYIGFISWIFGWSVYHGALLSLGIGSIGVLSILWWKHLEEERLEHQFGSAYTTYRQTTWF